MIKKSQLFIFISLLFITLMFILSPIAMANPIEDPNSFKPGPIQEEDANVITERANSIIGVFITVGVVIAAVTLTILGIKYMMGSVEEKAEYKKSMIPYLIGSILLFATSTIVGIIANIVEDMNL